MRYIHKNQRGANPALVLCFGMSGVGLFVLAVIRSRLLDHTLLRFVQQGWDAIAGTYGAAFNVLTFLIGASTLAGAWLFCLVALLLRNRRPAFQCAVLHVTGVFVPTALLGVPGVLTLLAGLHVLWLSCVIVALVVLWMLGRIILYAGDVQPCSAEPKGSIGNCLLRCVVACLLIMVPIGLMLVGIRYVLHRGAIDNGVLSYTAMVMSFDTEIDWCPQEDAVRNKDFPSRSFGLISSYKYITSGLLEKLALGLSDRKIPATFYCTPNVAKDHPEVLQRLEKLGHEIGVHLHPHNYLRFRDGSNELSSYPSGVQAEAILEAKQDIEEAVGHRVHTFRSGEWSCDPGVESACARAGFQSISNHESTYLLPSGMWQIATAKDFDIIIYPRMFWRSLKWDNGHKLIPLFSHPMLLWDHATNEPREKVLQQFFQELDEFRLKYPNKHFITTMAAASLLRYKPPSIWIRIAAGGLSILLILACLITSLRGQGVSRDKLTECHVCWAGP